MTRSVLVLTLLASVSTAHSGEIYVNLGLQATTTGWPDDAGGGPTIGATWWFRSWIGATFIGKEHYARVDERYMSYFSINGAIRKPLGRFRLGGTFGFVHQHEQGRASIEDQPLQSLFGVADGTRHRMGSRAGLELALPFSERAKGDWYVALSIDATLFAENDRGPGWMSSAGLAVGFTHDFARGAK